MTILYLTSNPRAYKLFLAELDDAAARGAISSPIQMSEARQLPYLQAVVREGMRIYPGGTPLAFKTVPSGGDEISGYRLPAGTQVGMNVWGALRDKEFWGDDADLFRPERWMNVPESRLSSMTECLDFQFGYGRYQCLGRPVVFMELNKTIPEVSFACILPRTVSLTNSEAPPAVRIHRCKPSATSENQECRVLLDA
jgi:cytochrome P450